MTRSQTIIVAVAQEFGVTVDLLKTGIGRRAMHARAVACYMLNGHSSEAQKNIASLLSYSSHGAVIGATQRIEMMAKSGAPTKECIKRLVKAIGPDVSSAAPRTYGTSWAPADDIALMRMVASGMKAREIGEALGRTESAVRYRKHFLLEAQRAASTTTSADEGEPIELAGPRMVALPIPKAVPFALRPPRKLMPWEQRVPDLDKMRAGR